MRGFFAASPKKRCFSELPLWMEQTFSNPCCTGGCTLAPHHLTQAEARSVELTVWVSASRPGASAHLDPPWVSSTSAPAFVLGCSSLVASGTCVCSLLYSELGYIFTLWVIYCPVYMQFNERDPLASAQFPLFIIL